MSHCGDISPTTVIISALWTTSAVPGTESSRNRTSISSRAVPRDPWCCVSFGSPKSALIRFATAVNRSRKSFVAIAADRNAAAVEVRPNACLATENRQVSRPYVGWSPALTRGRASARRPVLAHRTTFGRVCSTATGAATSPPPCGCADACRPALSTRPPGSCRHSGSDYIMGATCLPAPPRD
jgi:hypothetical protein